MFVLDSPVNKCQVGVMVEVLDVNGPRDHAAADRTISGSGTADYCGGAALLARDKIAGRWRQRASGAEAHEYRVLAEVE